MKAYEGPRLTDDRLAVLKLTDRGASSALGGCTTAVEEADGEPVGGAPAILSPSIKIRPGRHHVWMVHYCGALGFNQLIGNGMLRFHAEAGRVYRVRGDRRGDDAWFWIEDVASGEVVAGETRAEGK